MSNNKATLVKPTGERITPETESVNPVESDTGVEVNEINSIVDSLLLVANFAGDKPTGALGESLPSFTRAIISRLCAPIDDIGILVDVLKKRRKATLEYANELAGDVERDWIKEVGELGRVFNADGTPIWIEGKGDGWEFKITVDEAVRTSASKLLYEFCKSSYYAINGAAAKKGQNGKRSSPKPSFHENPDKRGLTKDGYGHSPSDKNGECDWAVNAALQVMMKGGKAGTLFIKAVHLLMDVVKNINESDKEGARKALSALLGRDGTGRFHFTENTIRQLIRIRFLGSIVSDLQSEIRQLEALPADVDKLREWKKSRSEDVRQYLTYIDQALPPAESGVPSPVVSLGGE